MISLATAQKLKAAGLKWQPKMLDCFGIPDRAMDERVFVISDMLATIERLQGLPVVAFQGASEWALDAIVTSEVVWMPREDQLREALVTGMLELGEPEFMLRSGLGGSRCTIVLDRQTKQFEAPEASEAYAAALLHLLAHRRDS